MTQSFQALGQSGVTEAGEILESFEKPKNVTIVTMTSDEVAAKCPVTGQPDFYTVKIQYMPSTKCIESKSLKLYLQSFWNEGIFVEALAAQIAQHVMTSIEPSIVNVVVTQKSRGGITIEAESELSHEWGGG